MRRRRCRWPKSSPPMTARAAFQDQVPVRVERIVRGESGDGDAGGACRRPGATNSCARCGANESHFAGEGGEISSVDLRDDPEAGRLRDHLQRADPDGLGPGPGRRRATLPLRQWHDQLGGELRPPRRPVPGRAVRLPRGLLSASTETIILPRGGEGFSIDGREFRPCRRRHRISRQLTIADGRATARSEFRRAPSARSAPLRRAPTRRDDHNDPQRPGLSARTCRPGDAGGACVPGPRASAAGAPAAPSRPGRRPAATDSVPAAARAAVEQRCARLQGGDDDGAEADFARAGDARPDAGRGRSPIAVRSCRFPRAAATTRRQPLLAQRRRARSRTISSIPPGAGPGSRRGRNRPVQAVVEYVAGALEARAGRRLHPGRHAPPAYEQAGELDDALAATTSPRSWRAAPGRSACRRSGPARGSTPGAARASAAVAAADALLADGAGRSAPCSTSRAGILRARSGGGRFPAAEAYAASRLAAGP